MAFKALSSQPGPTYFSKSTTFIPRKVGPMPWSPHFTGLHSDPFLAVSHLMGQRVHRVKETCSLWTSEYPKFTYGNCEILFLNVFLKKKNNSAARPEGQPCSSCSVGSGSMVGVWTCRLDVLTYALNSPPGAG